MKIIQAMKLIKTLLGECQEIRVQIAQYCAYPNLEDPVYNDQSEQIDRWLQAHKDKLQKVLELRIGIQRANLATMVSINGTERCIAAWRHRRRDLAELERQGWGQLSDRGIREGSMKNSQTQENVMVKIVRCYDPEKRDKMKSALAHEASIIDSELEVVNAVTDIVE